MAASRLSSLAAMAAAGASVSAYGTNRAYAEGSFRFSPFSSSSSSSSSAVQTPQNSSTKPPEEEPRRGSTGFDPEGLERGAKALREINSSPNVKKVFEIMRNQEETRLAELEAEKAQLQAFNSSQDIVSVLHLSLSLFF